MISCSGPDAPEARSPTSTFRLTCGAITTRQARSWMPRPEGQLLSFVWPQKLCKELGEKGKDINDDIASLVRKGLDARVQMALDAVRVIGNNAAHPGKLDLRDDRPTAETLFDLVNLICEKMISEPKHVKAVYEKLPQSAREAIEKRDTPKK
jgi:hypothetical protein